MNDQITKRKRHILAAWLVGGFIYMVLAIKIIADAGFMAIPFQFIIGAVFSIVFVGFAALLGLLLRIPSLGRAWYTSTIPSAVVLVCAAFIILFGESIGITGTDISKSGMPYKTLDPTAAWSSMLAAVFATLHFPRKRVSRDTPTV